MCFSLFTLRYTKSDTSYIYTYAIIILYLYINFASASKLYFRAEVVGLLGVFRGTSQARSHNEANEAVASPKISKKNLPQMKNS